MTVGRKQQETDEKRGEREWKKEQAKGEKELAFFSFNTYPLISSLLHSAIVRVCACVCVCVRVRAHLNSDPSPNQGLLCKVISCSKW